MSLFFSSGERLVQKLCWPSRVAKSKSMT